MVAYSFQARFMVPIVERTKRQTIRAPGKRRHARPGQALQQYFGMRTKYCRLIGTATAHRVCRIVLDLRGDAVFFPSDLETIRDGELDEFAIRDGFKSWAELRRFWDEFHRGVNQFEGVLIDWDDTFTPAPAA